MMFPVGARVLVDGKHEAIVKQAFPDGSSSFLFPHYKLDFIGGDKNVAVNMTRVGVERAYPDRPKTPEKKHVDFDPSSDCWGIFGVDSGHCYGLYSGEQEANDKLRKNHG